MGGKRGWLWVHVSRWAGVCGERVVVVVVMCGHCQYVDMAEAWG